MRQFRAAVTTLAALAALAAPVAAAAQDVPPQEDTLKGFFATFLDALTAPRHPEGSEPPVSASYSLKDLIGPARQADELEEPMVPGPGASDPPPESDLVPEPVAAPAVADAPGEAQPQSPATRSDRPAMVVLPAPSPVADCPGSGRAAATATLDQARRLTGCLR